MLEKRPLFEIPTQRSSLPHFNMVFQRSPVRRHEFDSSDEEENDAVENLTPLQIDWVDLSFTGSCAEVICISELPGCKYKDTNRNLTVDIAQLKAVNITDVFVFCSSAEMIRCRVPHLIDKYHWAGFGVHHYPVEGGSVLAMSECEVLIEQLRNCITFGHKTLLHCVSGLGVSCLAAAVLLLSLDEFMSPDHVISKMRQVRGQRAFQTVKILLVMLYCQFTRAEFTHRELVTTLKLIEQYNFVHEFRDMFKTYQDEQRNSTEVAAPRSLSR